MFEYPKIGTTTEFAHRHCIAFEKYDGTNIGFTWGRKQGFYKQQLRKRLLDRHDPEFGPAIISFEKNWHDPLSQLIRDNFKTADQVTIFGEYWGVDTFAGNHINIPKDAVRKFTPFDIVVDGSFIPPDIFVKLTENMAVAEVVFRGKLTGQFSEDVRNGKYNVTEGVICKGVYKGEIWMAKVKTYAYQKRLQEVFGRDWQQYWE
jgi:hypothetical protein